MIPIAELTKADRGRWVRLSRQPYTNPGRILRWNDSHIFVLWHRGQFEKSLDHTQRAVAPEDLEFLDDEPQGEPHKFGVWTPPAMETPGQGATARPVHRRARQVNPGKGR